MLVNRAATLNILGEVFAPRLGAWFGFRICICSGSRSNLRSFYELQSLREVESGHAVLLEPKMQDAYVIEVKLGVHLLALLVHLVLLGIRFL